MSRSAVAFVCVLAALCSVAHAYTGLKGSTYQGFTFTNDVRSYFGLSLDCAAIKAAAVAKNFAGANTIYTKGKNFIRAGVPRSLQTVGNTPRTGEPFYTLYTKLYGAPNYVEKGVLGSTSLTAAVGIAKIEAACQLIMLGYLGHELDVAKKAVVSAPALALEEVNDGLGIWLGDPRSSFSLRAQVENVQNKWSKCAGPIIPQLVATFNGMKKAAQTKNQAAFDKSYNEFFRLNTAVYLRAISYAAKLKNLSWQKYAYAWLRVIQPRLTNQAAARQLAALLNGKLVTNPAQITNLVLAIGKSHGLTTPKSVGIC